MERYNEGVGITGTRSYRLSSPEGFQRSLDSIKREIWTRTYLTSLCACVCVLLTTWIILCE